MLNFAHQKRVFLCLDPVDMRKSFRGLCQLAESVLQEDPASGHWFVFIKVHAQQQATITQQQATIEQQQATIENPQAALESLTKDVALLKRSLFGPRRERFIDPNQRLLFDAAALGERHAQRQLRSRPLLSEFKTWMDQQLEGLTPKHELRGAIEYMTKRCSATNGFPL